ncbi:hypothetical protein [Streptomyces roseifaciens]|uniref:hypothetical protein n=1 Tax=Streptomyces roseifaciens TaxID=1488406 RepID=UPI000717FF45|nr:hypothetical protein [Streptomyces roseifaciens]
MTTKRLLDEVLAELLDTTDQSNPLDYAIVAAVEGAALIAVAAEEAERDADGGKPVELAQEALGAMRACVVATTLSVRTLEDRRRSTGKRTVDGRTAALS